MKTVIYSLTLLALSAVTANAQTTARKAVTPVQTARSTTQSARPAVKPAPAAQPVAQTKPTAQPVVQAEPVAQSRPAPKPQSATPATTFRKAPVASSGDRPAYLNLGIGLGAYTAGGLPIGLSFEKTIKDNLSVGGSADFSRYGYNYGGYKWNYTFIYVGARGSYHFGELLNVGNPKFDPYAGVSLGFRHASYKDTYGYGSNDYNPYNSGLYLGIHLGSRYMFNEKFGGFAEVGYGIAALKLGLAAKF